MKDIHDDAFEIIDQNPTHPTKGWPENESKGGLKPSGMDEEMRDTMALFNRETDETSCGCGTKKGASKIIRAPPNPRAANN